MDSTPLHSVLRLRSAQAHQVIPITLSECQRVEWARTAVRPERRL